MNLPNKLTILRVIMIPFFVLALLYNGGENQTLRYVAAAIFIIASLTDMLDGKIARKYNLVTNFGKFMDPLADKLLVCSALICLVELKELRAWMVIVIISRECIISGFRPDRWDPGPVHGDNGRGMDRPDPDCDLSGGLYREKRECSERRENVMIRTEKGYGQIFKIYGVSETEVKDALKEILNQGSAIPVYTRRRGKEVHVLAETAETDEERAKELLRPISRSIKKALGDMYYTTRENETMEEAVVRLLVKNKLTVTTVESCTGGMIASKIVNVAGASEVFNQGFVTYSNRAKRKMVGVGKNTLKKYGAVSEPTAREMAAGGAEEADAEAAVAVTGIAGPDGGTDEKPVGLVYIACCLNGDVTVEECHFHGSRTEIREQSAMEALDLLRRCILKNCG